MASRRGHHFGHFKAYLLQLIRQAESGLTFLKTKEIVSDSLSYDLADRMPASCHPGLQLADIAVSSVFQALETLGPLRNHEPALSLIKVVAARKSKKASKQSRANFGLTLFPFNQAKQLVTAEQKGFFTAFGYKFD